MASKTQEKLSKGITGIAGEYYVAAELSRNGFMASITLRNNESVDIHASHPSSEKIFKIQVKTKQYKANRYPLSEKAETRSEPNLFYVFVNLRDKLQRPEFFIVPSKEVAQATKQSHKSWLDAKSKSGQPHKDSSMRNFSPSIEKHLEKWELLLK